MGDRIARAVILAEDLRSANLLRRYLQRAVNPRNIVQRIAPPGQGDAKVYVKMQYPVEVAEQRQRVHGKHRNQSLVTHIDADKDSVESRHSELAESLRAAGHASRNTHELLAIVVPRRHTETWLYGLTDVSVTEDYDCKRDPEGRMPGNPDGRIGPTAERLYELTRPNASPPPPELPSVALAVQELRRLEP